MCRYDFILLLKMKDIFLTHLQEDIRWRISKILNDYKFIFNIFFVVLLSDRSRLKADKQALLFQIQEMQKTVDDKEEQLREFLREYNLQAKVIWMFNDNVFVWFLLKLHFITFCKIYYIIYFTHARRLCS